MVKITLKLIWQERHKVPLKVGLNVPGEGVLDVDLPGELNSARPPSRLCAAFQKGMERVTKIAWALNSLGNWWIKISLAMVQNTHQVQKPSGHKPWWVHRFLSQETVQEGVAILHLAPSQGRHTELGVNWVDSPHLMGSLLMPQHMETRSQLGNSEYRRPLRIRKSMPTGNLMPAQTNYQTARAENKTCNFE